MLRVTAVLIVGLTLLVGCANLTVEQAEPPSTPISTFIQRLDDPNQADITYSAKQVYQRGPGVADADGIPPDRVGWTLLGLENRVSGVRRYRLTLALAYENDQTAGYRSYDHAKVMPNGPALTVQPYSRKSGLCTGYATTECFRQEVVFVWLPEAVLKGAGPGGLSLEVGGQIGRIWQFTVPDSLIQALFAKMDQYRS